MIIMEQRHRDEQMVSDKELLEVKEAQAAAQNAAQKAAQQDAAEIAALRAQVNNLESQMEAMERKEAEYLVHVKKEVESASNAHALELQQVAAAHALELEGAKAEAESHALELRGAKAEVESQKL